MTLSDDANLYAPFRRSLQALQTRVLQANPDVPSLHADFLDLQQYFQSAILSAEPFDEDEVNIARLMSYQTEISKELRLLGMDMMFLQAARKAMSIQQRQAQMRDRLERLMGYCDRIMELLKQA
jgi:hypothetical protein